MFPALTWPSRSGAKGDGFVALVAKGGGGDDGRIELDHGESERK